MAYFQPSLAQRSPWALRGPWSPLPVAAVLHLEGLNLPYTLLSCQISSLSTTTMAALSSSLSMFKWTLFSSQLMS